MHTRRSLVLVLLMLLTAGPSAGAPPSPVGRWDLTLVGQDGSFPSWLEITERNGSLEGRFVGRAGAVRDVERLVWDRGRLAFAVKVSPDGLGDVVVFDGECHRTWMRGTIEGFSDIRTWTAARAPALPKPAKIQWDAAIPLFDGRSLSGWHRRWPTDPTAWFVRNGELICGGAVTDLVSDQQFQDFQLHLEFKLPKDGDSGVHLRGRYEIQLRDDAGPTAEPRNGYAGSIYSMIAPKAAANLEPDAWHALDATLVGRYVTVVIDGVTLIDDQEIPGITGDALDSREGTPGPIVLQGYLGSVAYRNIIVTPARK